MDQLIKMAKSGDPQAQLRLYLTLDLQAGEDPDKKREALSWLKQAASKGFAPAEKLLVRAEKGRKVANQSDRLQMMMVDDERAFAEILIDSCEGLPVDIHYFESSAKALQQLKNKKSFDLCILDYEMPVINGLQMLQTIREIDALKHLRILMISGFSKPEYIIFAKKLNVEAWLVKPLNPMKFRQIVADVIKNQKKGAQLTHD